MRILVADEEVAGVSHRLSDARTFVKGRSQELRLEEEPGNSHDPNAIKVIGVYKRWFTTHSVHLGYVPAEIAKMIAARALSNRILPRLKNIWWGGYVRDYIVVRFDILEPKPPRGETERPSKRGKAKTP
jgi:hypothetical protein